MALRVTTATKKDIALSMRFEPKMYSFQTSLNHAKQRYHFRPLSEIATDIKRGQSPKPETYKNERTGKYIFLRTADVKKYSLSTEGVVWLDEATFKTQKANRIQKDDLLVSVVGNYFVIIYCYGFSFFTHVSIVDLGRPYSLLSSASVLPEL